MTCNGKERKFWRLLCKNFILSNISDLNPGGEWDEAATNEYHGSLNVCEKKVCALVQIMLLKFIILKQNIPHLIVPFIAIKTCYNKPGIFPTEATDNINSSTKGNGDFPMKYVLETSSVQVLNVSSG